MSSKTVNNNNNTNNNNNNSNRNRKTSRNKRHTSKGVASQLNGVKYSPATNPPDTTSQPWYPITLSWIGTSGNFDFDNLIAIFRRQLDPTHRGLNPQTHSVGQDSAFRILFKLQSIAIWNITGRAVSLTVFDCQELSNSGKLRLGGWTDIGNPSQFPCIGYHYPLAHAQRVHRPDEKNHDTWIFNTTASSKQDKILHHLRLVWHFDGAAEVIQDCVSPQEEVIVQSKECLDRIEKLAEKIDGAQPSTVEKILDGVKVAAGLVVALAANEAASGSTSDYDVLDASTYAHLVKDE